MNGSIINPEEARIKISAEIRLQGHTNNFIVKERRWKTLTGKPRLAHWLGWLQFLTRTADECVPQVGVDGRAEVRLMGFAGRAGLQYE